MSQTKNTVMCIEKSKLSILAWLNYAVFLVIFCLPFTCCSDVENHAYHINPTTVRQFLSSYKHSPDAEYYNEGYFTQKGSELVKNYPTEKVFQIEPSDAIDINKYSQPAVGQMNVFSGLKVPSMTLPSDKVSLPVLTLNHKTQNFPKLKPTYDGVPKNISKPMRDLRFLESATDQNPKSSSGSKYKFESENTEGFLSDTSFREPDSQDKNNFTNADTNLLPVSSDAILSYHIPSNNKKMGTNKNSSDITPELDINISSHSFEKPVSNPTVINSISSTPSELITETAIIFNTYQIDVFNQTDSVDFAATLIPSHQDEANFSSGMPLLNNGHEKLSSGSVAGIVVAVLVCVTLLSSAVIYLLYRKYNGKCTSVVDGKFNTDNCGYLDDSLRSSIYLNNHIELPKESSEEMSSLDNDSFLNSLETMTIQNYWADNSKNTKV